jgi:phage shock protein E
MIPWTSISIAIVVLAGLLLVKRGGLVSEKAARVYLRQGAMIIDVRSAGEFTAGHLPKAINIPLSEIETVIWRKVNAQKRVLLLHCQSGMRSRTATKKLRALGYTNAFNLGSYGRAAQILASR